MEPLRPEDGELYLPPAPPLATCRFSHPLAVWVKVSKESRASDHASVDGRLDTRISIGHRKLGNRPLMSRTD